MRRHLLAALVGGVICTIPSQVSAQQPAEGFRAKSPEVVKRGADGRALVVRVDGREIPVCQNEQQDSCIQPRAAGLGWGDWPAPVYREKRPSRDSRTNRDDSQQR